ncbi:amino acid adenylation domain-containing protein [Streptomyces sp. NPDC001351]|uniref:amino acid adenylation domain-containing protein n=1 Tax=Streptomyces sp. NPDC001351 TaxID=3364564 RepID=UPI00368BB362
MTDLPPPHPAAVTEWNRTTRDYPRDATLVDLLDRAVDTHLGLPAVRTTEGPVLTHDQLAKESLQLARGLSGAGVRRGSPVAVLMDHLPETVVALHAVVRAGAYYVPLDPRWPVSRIVKVVRSLGVRLLVASSGLREMAVEIGNRVGEIASIMVPPGVSDQATALAPELLTRSGEEGVFARQRQPQLPGEPLEPPTPDDLAYVIFTSGSTGDPKGVAVRHRSVVNLIDWFNRRNGVGPDDVVLQMAAFSFDLSVYDVFGVPAGGGSVLLLPGDELADPYAVCDALLEHGVTLWNSAPAAFTLALMFAREIEGGDRGRLRRVFLSGDWVPVDTLATLKGEFPHAVLVALGGATEACVWSNDFVVDRVDPDWSSIPYGHPMQNSRYYVLRPDMSPCDVGEAGELVIAGDCVSAGYVNDPALTDLRFLPDPWAADPGDRMYRTGDRARWTPDGWVEFLGRLDSQVKVRGFRIELGEVEQAARQLPGVAEAVAVTCGEPRDPVLALALRMAIPASGRTIARLLADELPAYMLPSKIHTAVSLPVGPTGKVDRAALSGFFTRESASRPGAATDPVVAPLH